LHDPFERIDPFERFLFESSDRDAIVLGVEDDVVSEDYLKNISECTQFIGKCIKLHERLNVSYPSSTLLSASSLKARIAMQLFLALKMT